MIEARYRGKCRLSGRPINPGDLIGPFGPFGWALADEIYAHDDAEFARNEMIELQRRSLGPDLRAFIKLAIANSDREVA